MESNSVRSGTHVSGKLSADNTLLFTDLFHFFPQCFQKVSTEFENDFRLISYSDPGFTYRGSERRMRHSSLEKYADDFIEKLEGKGFGNIIYLAHSINGLLALIAARKAPHLFKKIVLTSATPCLLYNTDTRYSCEPEPHQLDDLFAQAFGKNDSAADAEQSKPVVQLTDILSSAFATLNEEEARALFDMLYATDCRHYLGDIEVPTVILQVAADRVATPEAGYLMYRTIPNSQFIKIKGKGQLPFMNAPEQIITAMQLFMNTPMF